MTSPIRSSKISPDKRRRKEYITIPDIGKIKIRPNAVPSSGKTASIEDIVKAFEKAEKD